MVGWGNCEGKMSAMEVVRRHRPKARKTDVFFFFFLLKFVFLFIYLFTNL